MLFLGMAGRKRFATAGGIFGTIFSATLSSSGSGYASFTYRHKFVIAGLTVPPGTQTQVRVGFKAHPTTEGVTISAAYIGHKGAGDQYDFATTPVQFLFSGSGSTTIAAGTSLVTDNANFTWDKVSDLIISMYISDTAHDSMAFTTGTSNYNSYNKSASDASTVDATGYSDTGNRLDGIYLIEMDGF